MSPGNECCLMYHTLMGLICTQMCACLWLIVVVVNISAVSVRRRISRGNGSVFIIVVLTAGVVGTRVVPPVRHVSLQPLVRQKHHGCHLLINSIEV